MNLPRLYIGGSFSRILHPSKVSLSLNIKPLSRATMDLPKGESIPIRSIVQMFSPYGSAGFFRSRTPEDGYGAISSTAVELEHAIAEAGDWLVREKISEMMPATDAIKRFWKHYRGKYWKLGDVSAIGTGKVSVSVDYDNILNSIQSVMEQRQTCMLAFDFSTTPWTLSIVKKPTTVTAECRLARNVDQARISTDDTEQCTRVYYESFSKDKDGNTVSTWKSIDAPGITPETTIERTVNISSDLTEEEGRAIAQTFLNEHKDPRVSVTIEGVDLSEITGQPLDKFETGKLLRLAIPEDGITVEKHIRSLNWQDVYGHPRKVTVLVGDEEDTVVSFLHNLDSKGKGSRGGGGGGGGQREKEVKDYFKQYDADIKKSDKKIELYARENERIGSIVKQAGMDLDRNGVLIYSKSSPLNLQSMIDVQSNRISLVVKGYGKNATIDTAKIVAGINKQTGSFVKIQARNIELSGYTTLQKFTALEGRLDKLLTGKTSATILAAGSVQTGTLRVGGTLITKRSTYIPDVGFINYLGYSAGG